MKSRIIHLAIMALAVGVIGASCNQQERKTAELQRINDSMENPHNYVDTANADRLDWENFRNEAQARVKQNEDSIAAFRKRLEKFDTKLKAKFSERISRLEIMNTDLRKKIDGPRVDGKDNWEKFKQEFKSSLDTVDVRMKEVFTSDK